MLILNYSFQPFLTDPKSRYKKCPNDYFKARCVSSARAFLSGLKDEPAAVSSFEADVDHEDFNGEEGQISVRVFEN